MEIISILAAVTTLAIVYLPVYAPALISFALRSPKWAVMRWGLRCASIALIALLIYGLPDLKSAQPGFDIGSEIGYAKHNIMIILKWIWGGGITLCLIAVASGLLASHFYKSENIRDDR